MPTTASHAASFATEARGRTGTRGASATRVSKDDAAMKRPLCGQVGLLGVNVPGPAGVVVCGGKQEYALTVDQRVRKMSAKESRTELELVMFRLVQPLRHRQPRFRPPRLQPHWIQRFGF
ncbi:uncharacterized protein LOC112042263 [Lingula anatina]|uniref:Uncharacterized protein LOC112042263 n=1 Tax=Lingula anatina TaxID=7574 RepID=A0A2R2MQM9_LINAN|nr:uncharacterized protein LOC112042263 [Lingula anatina]|eukprot:XP_023932307.1 uncharacterized protein LOC112042263 [Lingula anatina]